MGGSRSARKAVTTGDSQDFLMGGLSAELSARGVQIGHSAPFATSGFAAEISPSEACFGSRESTAVRETSANHFTGRDFVGGLVGDVEKTPLFVEHNC